MYDVAPLQVPLLPTKLFATFAEPATLADFEALGLLGVGVGVGVGVGLLADQTTVHWADDVVPSTVATILDCPAQATSAQSGETETVA